MLRKKPKNKEVESFPSTLAGFGYYVKPDGSIRSIQSDTPYDFEYKLKDRVYNEARYEAFTRIIADMVIQKLEQLPLNMIKAPVPSNVTIGSSEPHTYILMTRDALTTPDKLLVLIPGSQLSIGQWSRRVMCDDNINEGSMITTCLKALEQGYQVIITNPNANYWSANQSWNKRMGSKSIYISESDTPENHIHHVFEHYIKPSAASNIAIMGQGWAGHLIEEQLNSNFDLFKEKVKAIALADSVHSRDMVEGDDKRVFLFEKVTNWMASVEEKKDAIIRDPRFGCTCISAGVEIADFTLPTSLNDMFKFYQRQFGEQTFEDEIVTNSARQEMEENELEDLNEFITVVDRDENVEI
ncbi:hypothetical protein K450DRAFT_231454 [Umbelopsis ramanniana AG]|uniref:Arb2 domain-containing protein n=1 Tax=Umbelopsis ramanniana AG TaxID=1314678 RepID=A0AAD5ED11_UMBRA|nr:uncharacterized protein K450DRAFT_231454 [Umbelopsis ramanniana AG]KAI8581468.1 hypothetical protein K450DRAFT_231454 [Umbelopsis ramanniana AG]